MKYASRGWKSDARARSRGASQVIVICGRYTNQAVGVSAEVEIAREAKTPYYLLQGRKSAPVRRPKGTHFGETVYPWARENLSATTTGQG